MSRPSRKAVAVVTLVAVAFVGWFWFGQGSGGARTRPATDATPSAPSGAQSASTRATPDGSRILDSMPPSTAKAEPSATAAAPAVNAAWIEMQQSSSLRARMAQAMLSNDPREAAATMNAMLYCNLVASKRAVSPADAAEAELVVFPGHEQILRRSPLERRADEIEAARKRCAYGEEGISRSVEAELRRTLSTKLESVNELVRRARQVEGVDWSALTAEDRALLASGRVDVPLRVLGALGDRWGSLDDSRPDGDIAAQLARHLAACRLGDPCGAGSFRQGEVCVVYGGCDGADVEQAIDRLIIDETTRQRTQRLLSRIMAQMAAVTGK